MAVKEYFPGANTPTGFHSYYNDILKNDEAENIIILKGGPGTGKSSLMKKTASYAARMGYDIELLHCSSDPDSLDGVCIREKGFMIIDGTAPHIVDPKFPGAVDRIINLGEYWKADEIRPFADNIRKLSKDISNEFCRAYSYMNSAHTIMNQIKQDICFDQKIVMHESETTVKKLDIKNHGYAGKIRKGFLNAHTHLGNISYAGSFANNAAYVICVIPDIGGAYAEYMSELARNLTRSGFSVRIFYNSMNPEYEISHIYIEEQNVFITTDNIPKSASDRWEIVDFNSFYHETSYPVQYASDVQLYNTLMSNATESLKRAKNLHDELEKYYIPHMDFEASSSALDSVLDELSHSTTGI